MRRNIEPKGSLEVSKADPKRPSPPRVPPICQRLIGGCTINKRAGIGISHYHAYPFPPLPFEVGVISLILQIREGRSRKAVLFAQGHTGGEQQGANWNPDGSEPHLWLSF